MQCQTVLPGTECTFWSKQGCIFEGHSCQPIIEECEGCERIAEGTIGRVCTVAPSPKLKWANKELCNFATHRKIEIQSIEAKVNPLKASKKAAAGKGGGKKK